MGKPAPFTRYLFEQLTPEECVLVGDSTHDLHAARAAGIPAIAVSYGYNQGIDLSTESLFALVDDFADILAYFERPRAPPVEHH